MLLPPIFGFDNEMQRVCVRCRSQPGGPAASVEADINPRSVSEEKKRKYSHSASLNDKIINYFEACLNDARQSLAQRMPFIAGFAIVAVGLAAA
jgi:hypothetical protein